MSKIGMIRTLGRLRTAFVVILTTGCVTSCRTVPAERPSNLAAKALGEGRRVVSHAGIHNVLPVADGLISGSVPEGEDGFRTLSQLGIRTIVSVDGVTPDVAGARRYGMRYVHFPVGYDGIARQRQLELARAVRDLPGPAYVHCHHGRHRGPAAAASAAVALGRLRSAAALAFMRRAGTSDHYHGLYDSVASLAPASADALAAVPDDLPEIAPLPGFVKAMASAQQIYDRLAEIRDADWHTPADHPDLVAVNEAGRLENVLRALRDDARTRTAPVGFQEMMRSAHDAARSLEAAIATGAPPRALTARLGRLQDSCRACHVSYRDRSSAIPQ